MLLFLNLQIRHDEFNESEAYFLVMLHTILYVDI